MPQNYRHHRSFLIKQILAAIVYLHENKITITTLSPDNILFENEKPNSNLKITDFDAFGFFNSKKLLMKKSGNVFLFYLFLFICRILFLLPKYFHKNIMKNVIFDLVVLFYIF